MGKGARNRAIRRIAHDLSQLHGWPGGNARSHARLIRKRWARRGAV